ncbi:helix-turn-helix domain-containing protein [Acerihabitans sp. TG2]|uniref:helix-turn-helix domain-containing protein n=1 Tax=Acerihabitans sp. TG2 TaxID=3096008 RepID=UPI002B23DBBC|nr:helix-turn-helix domain-containing protein [Acerihabitans sp. TG2]MEA9389789.1 helix-turn-helix domain-containing protein [Acerihabitans sp. TG2]
MVYVPLPFVVALLLFMNLMALLKTLSWRRISPAFLALLGMTILQAVLLGLRWGYGITELRYILPVTAAAIPPLVLASFYKLTDDQRTYRIPAWVGFVFPPLIITLLFIRSQLIDAALIIIFIAHAAALIDLYLQGPDRLNESRLNESVPVQRALLIAAVSLSMSALFDLSVLLNFEWNRGEHAAFIISGGNILSLLLTGLTAPVVARAKNHVPSSGSKEKVSSPDQKLSQDESVMSHIDSLLCKEKLYLDPDLTLSRLARRACIPSRQISVAINRIRSKNVSQYVNEFRVSEACRRLESGNSVTEAMYSSGFQTKSNFNREFRKITGLNPSEWRVKHK